MKSGHIHSALVTAAALALTPLHAADVDTNPGVTLNSSSPGNKYIGNGTLTVSGGSTVALGAASGSPTTEFAMTGGLIHIVAGTTLRNGGWQKGFWTNNEAGMQVNGSFDIWDGNPVTIDALTGQQAVLPNQGVNSMKALVTTAGANAWDAQSLGPSFATTVGTEYTMTFYAKAALANTGIRMVVQNANYLNRNFSLTTQWAKYTWTFTAVETTPRVRIHYFEAGTFWIDNISVVPTASIPITLTINPEIRHQEMVGFGGSLTWYRERVLTSRHSATIKQLLFEDLGLDRLGWEPDYLSFQNEPGYVATWKSCIFRPTQTPVHAGYAETSDAIYNAIKDRPNAPIMIGAEVESIGSATWSDWKNGAQVNRFREMNTPLLSRPYIGAHAYHTYNMQNESQIDGAIPLLNMIRDEFSDRPNFMTEYSNNNYDWLAAARVVHNTVVEANASAYFYWTLVWEKSASTMIGISSDGEYTVGPHYQMLKHYSKHVSIGHRRIEVSGSTSDVKISGFINPDETEITMVVINNSTSAKNVELVQTSLPVRSTVAYQSVVDHYFQNIGDIDLSGLQTLPAKSMTTYVVSLPPNRTWTGASGTAWDVNNSANWLEGDQKFYQFDKVTFGDTGAGTVVVTGVLTPGSITVNSTSNYNFTAAVGNHIAGAGSLTKSGSGILNLTGANAYTGNTNIRQGILNLGGETASGSIASSSPLVMTGGTLAYTTTGSQTQTFAGTSISSGASAVSVVTDNTLNLGTITRTAGATVNLDRTTGSGTIQGSATLTSDILRWASVSNTGTAANLSTNGFTFATVSGGAVVPYTTAASSSFSWSSTAAATVNYDVTNASGSLGAARTANSVRFVGAANTIQQYYSSTLTLNALMNASTSSLTLRPDGGSTPTLVIGNSNELVLTAAAGQMIIAMPITGITGSLTKTGANTVALSGTNTYGSTTGRTNVNAGTLLTTKAAALPGYYVKSGSGTLTLSGFTTHSGNTTVTGGTLILGDGTNNTGLSDLAALSVGTGATLQLNYSAASPDTIHKLFLGGVQAASGTWGSLTSTAANKSALITGTGLLNVLSAPPFTDPFASWMTTNYPGILPPNNEPGADPDNDGIANLVEYILQGGEIDKLFRYSLGV